MRAHRVTPTAKLITSILCRGPSVPLQSADTFELAPHENPHRWLSAEAERLQFVSIDSAVKLFPPGHDLSRADLASEVFNQLQRLPTVWIIAHDRKPQSGITAIGGNAEIVGSGRFAQDPDVIHEMARPDRRAPVAWFSWGKMREGEKADAIPLYFDRVDYRLYPLHPYLHLLPEGPTLESNVISEALLRYGWKERRARQYLTSLRQVVDSGGNRCVREGMRGHNKVLEVSGAPTGLERAHLTEQMPNYE
jgi:hypothetical protein